MPTRYVSQEIDETIDKMDGLHGGMSLSLSEKTSIAFGRHRVFILCIALRCSIVVERKQVYCSKHKLEL